MATASNQLSGPEEAAQVAKSLLHRSDEDGEYWMRVPEQNRNAFMASFADLPGISLRQLLDIYGERCAQPAP